MRRIMSFLEPAAGKELVLPVTPDCYEWTHGSRVETIQLDQLGEINLPGGRLLGSCTLAQVLLPARLYAFCNPGASADPYGYLEQLERWSDGGTPVRWIVSGTPTNALVLIESVTYGQRDGTDDLYASISLRQYAAPETPVLALSGTRSQVQTPARDSSTGASSARSYTVRAGDTLWGISSRFYGDGSLSLRLAAANGLKNPNLLTVGQTLTIPPRDQLPAAMQVSASVQTAAATKTVYSKEDKIWKVQLAKEQAAMR